MKQLIATALVTAMMVAATPGFADGTGDGSWEHNGYHGHLRYQTANVWDTSVGPTQRIGAGWLVRSKSGIRGRVMTNVPTSGDPYTLWIVIFNNPGACVDGCNDEDLANPEVQGIAYNGTGAISASNIHGTGILNLDFEIESGKLPNGQFVLFPFDERRALRRGNGFNAEVHLVIDQHPPIVPGADSWIKDLTETNFPGAGPATSVAAGIFVPCPDSSCPESVL